MDFNGFCPGKRIRAHKKMKKTEEKIVRALVFLCLFGRVRVRARRAVWRKPPARRETVLQVRCTSKLPSCVLRVSFFFRAKRFCRFAVLQSLARAPYRPTSIHCSKIPYYYGKVVTTPATKTIPFNKAVGAPRGIQQVTAHEN